MSDRIILTAGVWDFFHRGHQDFLRKCWILAGPTGKLVVLVNSDEFTLSYKGIKPTEDEITRVNQVRNCKYVDQAFILPAHHDQKRILDEQRPTIVVHGTDWTGEGLYVQFGVTKEWLEERNILFAYVDRTPGISSTELRRVHGA